MPIALPYHICRLGEPCDKPCRFAAMYNNASFRVCRHARFCRPSDIREPRSRLPLGSSPSPSTPQKSSRHAAGLLNGTGMEGFGRSCHSPLGGEWLKLVVCRLSGFGRGGQKEAVWQCAGFWGRQWYQWQSDRGAIELGLHIFMCQRQMIYKRNRGADDVARLPGKFGRQYGAHSQN